MEKWYLFNVYTFCKSPCVINVGSPYGLHGDPIYIWYLYDQMWLVGYIYIYIYIYVYSQNSDIVTIYYYMHFTTLLHVIYCMYFYCMYSWSFVNAYNRCLASLTCAVGVDTYIHRANTDDGQARESWTRVS